MEKGNDSKTSGSGLLSPQSMRAGIVGDHPKDPHLLARGTDNS